MKILTVLVGIIGLGVLLIYITQTSSKSQTNQPKSATEVDQIQNSTQPDITNDSQINQQPFDSNKYIEYSNGALDQANPRRVLFFFANWCPTCLPADKSFVEKVSLLPDDVTVIRVNYNDTETDEEEKALAKKYGVTYQHTYILIDQDGNEVKKWNGGQIEELLTRLK